MKDSTVSSSSTQANLIFATLALGFLMSSMNSTMVIVALPTMLADLGTSLAWVGWTLTGFQLSQTVVMPMAGKLSDDWGARRVFLGSISLFTVSSVAAGFAPNVYFLILCRILQAIGGGALLPTATSIVSQTFGVRRATYIGLFTSIFPLGGVLGPNIGGLIVQHLSWRWLFLINGPIGVAIIVIGMRLLPTFPRSTAGRRRVDVIGAALFTAAMVCILGSMTSWANNPDTVSNPLTWLAMATGVALLVVFLQHEGRTPLPMIELQLLRWRPFWASNLYNFIYGASVFGFFSFIPYYATVAYHMNPLESGTVLTPRSLAMVIMSTVSSLFLIRFGYRKLLILGVVFVSSSLFTLSHGFHNITFSGWQVPNLVLLSIMVLLSGLGMGISGPASNNAALDLLPDKVAAVAGLRGMFRSLGGVMGTAGIILALSFFDDKAAGLQDIFLFSSVAILLAIPVVFLIPDMARERYLTARDERRQPAEVGAGR